MIGIGFGSAGFGDIVASLVVVTRFNGFPFFVAAFSDGGVTYALTYAIWIALIGGWGLFRAVWHATPLCFIARLCCTTRRLVLPLAVDAFIERIDDAFIRAIGTRAVVGSFATRCRGSGRYADKEQSQMMSLHNITPMLRNYLKNQTKPKWLISSILSKSCRKTKTRRLLERPKCTAKWRFFVLRSCVSRRLRLEAL